MFHQCFLRTLLLFSKLINRHKHQSHSIKFDYKLTTIYCCSHPPINITNTSAVDSGWNFLHSLVNSIPSVLQPPNRLPEPIVWSWLKIASEINQCQCRSLWNVTLLYYCSLCSLPLNSGGLVAVVRQCSPASVASRIEWFIEWTSWQLLGRTNWLLHNDDALEWHSFISGRRASVLPQLLHLPRAN